MRSVLWHEQRVGREFEKVGNEREAMVFENRFIEPARDVLRCMAADPRFRDEVVDRRVKLLLRIARAAQEGLDSWRFERRVLGIAD